MMDVVLIGSPDDVRVSGFQRALQQMGCSHAVVVSYEQLIRGDIQLSEVVREGTWVRLESPGKDSLSNTLLLQLGSDDSETPSLIAETSANKGLIRAPLQWYRGLCRFLEMVTAQLADCKPHHLVNAPNDIALMFDKSACHQYLQHQEIAVPPSLGSVSSFDELTSEMALHNRQRVFVKLAHGSSASGVVAYETNGEQHKATAAVEMIERDGQVELYNTRKIRVYRDYGSIRNLINALCVHGVHVEAWIPKARMGDKTFDLRVVVIGGEATHVVARLSRHPMTNLHLLNERQGRDAVIACMGEANFQQAVALCERAMRLFPESLYAGVDLLVGMGYRQHVVLELNAFGDLLHHTLFRGLNTYATQIQRMIAYEHA